MTTDDFKLDDLTVNRTIRSTLTEVTCTLFVLVAWVVFLANWQSDEKFTPRLIAMVAMTAVLIYLLASTYRPKWVCLGLEVTNTVQLKHVIRMARIMALESVVLMLAIALSNTAFTATIPKAMLYLLIATRFFYQLYINHLKTPTKHEKLSI